MKTFAINQYKPIGDLDHLQEVALPKPSSPTGHDVLVNVKAVATNPIDYKRLGNLGNHQADFELDTPLVVGWDASGIVEEVEIRAVRRTDGECDSSIIWTDRCVMQGVAVTEIPKTFELPITIQPAE